MAFWVFVAALLLGGVTVLADEYRGLAATATAHLRLGAVWLAFVAASVWLILLFDPLRSMRRHPAVLAGAAALGGSAANAMAIYGNAFTRQKLGTLTALSTASHDRIQAIVAAPVVEESAKALCAGVILVLGAPALNRIAHALMIGMFTGFGFLLMENLNLATISGLGDPDSHAHGIGVSMAYRLPTVVSSHWCYTGLTAVAVLLLSPRFAGRRSWTRRCRLATSALLVLTALGMHALWNLTLPGMGLLAADGVKIGADGVVLVTAALALLRHERCWLTRQIAARGEADLIEFGPAVLDSLPTWRMRRALRGRVRRENGWAAARSVRARQREALDAIQAGTAAQCCVEIGYEIAPAFQRKGLGTAAGRALVQKAFDSGEVDTVIAETATADNESAKLLTRVGFSRDLQVPGPHEGLVWQWELSRPRPAARD